MLIQWREMYILGVKQDFEIETTEGRKKEKRERRRKERNPEGNKQRESGWKMGIPFSSWQAFVSCRSSSISYWYLFSRVASKYQNFKVIVLIVSKEKHRLKLEGKQKLKLKKGERKKAWEWNKSWNWKWNKIKKRCRWCPWSQSSSSSSNLHDCKFQLYFPF